MIKSRSIFTRSLPALVITCGMAAVSAPPAAAQTAGDLKCNGCVNSKDIKNKSIKTNDIKNRAVRTNKIRNNAVSNAKIRNNAVTSAKIADGAVTGAKVLNGSLTALDLGDGAGVDFAVGPETLSLTLHANTVVHSITVTAPRSGFVILNASGSFNFFSNAAVQCSSRLSP